MTQNNPKCCRIFIVTHWSYLNLYQWLKYPWRLPLIRWILGPRLQGVSEWPRTFRHATGYPLWLTDATWSYTNDSNTHIDSRWSGGYQGHDFKEFLGDLERSDMPQSIHCDPLKLHEAISMVNIPIKTPVGHIDIRAMTLRSLWMTQNVPTCRRISIVATWSYTNGQNNYIGLRWLGRYQGRNFR